MQFVMCCLGGLLRDRCQHFRADAWSVHEGGEEPCQWPLQTQQKCTKVGSLQWAWLSSPYHCNHTCCYHRITLLFSIPTLCRRKYDASMWSKLFDLLLNAPEQQLPLNEFIQPLDMKLQIARDFMYRSQIKHCQEVLQAYLCKH